MDYVVRCQKLCQVETRRLFFLMGIVASVILVFQCFTLPYGNVLFSLLPAVTVSVQGKDTLQSEISPESMRLDELTLLTESVKSISSSVVFGVVKENKSYDNETKLKDEDPEKDFAVEKDGDPDDDFELDDGRDPGNELPFEEVVELDNDFTLDKVRDPDNSFTQVEVAKPSTGFALDIVRRPDTGLALENGKSPDNEFVSSPLASPPVDTYINGTMGGKLEENSSAPVIYLGSNVSSKRRQETKALSNGENMGVLQISLSTLNGSFAVVSDPSMVKKKKREVPPTPLSEMNRLLLQSHVSSRLQRPQLSSVRDRQLLSAKKQITNAPILANDYELFAPVFRNVSIFKRSYELMERTLKVYVYKEGEKPIFHQPILKGIYASEGWFMKLMERNKRFVVKDPRKAHLFYMPFSSRYLQYSLYVPGSHDQKVLAKYLKNYVNMISAKYPFWNRTGGEDHFLAACHDWAPYETRHHMDHSIRALCNADVSEGFIIGKDVSLPETYVRSGQNPLRDLGGEPASKRPILAFFAGNMHGMVRPILLNYWENKDPEMKIFGPMPRVLKSKMTYIRYMKTSKYCICPRGYEVNSPRVVESIFYECVPVIISDNFVPPLFEVLDWEAFSVIIAEKDIPMLKEILTSIPKEKYRSMQLAVRKVQRHFLWHRSPVKYDLFHMVLHSIWFNRLNQISI